MASPLYRKAFAHILLLALLFSAPSFAQKTHNMKPNSQCRFVKGPKNNEGMTPCEACYEQGKKDQAALEAEVKKREQAQQAASAAALKKRVAEMKIKNDAKKAAIEAQSKNVVSFGLPETKPVKKVETKTLAPPVTAQNYLYTLWPARIYYNAAGLGKFVLNKDGDTILKAEGSPFLGFQGRGLKKAGDQSEDFPSGVVIAAFRDGTSNMYSKCWDIITEKEERLLNDDKIKEIFHIAGNYFLLGYEQYAFNAPRAQIYNIKTKDVLELSVPPRSLGVSVVAINTPLNKEKCKQIIEEGAVGFLIQHISYQTDEFKVYFVRKDGSIDVKTFYDLD